MDNGTAFRSAQLRELLSSWHVEPFYRAAFRAEGNGVVERHHRTTKSIAEKAGIPPEHAVYWYNISPRMGGREESVPQRGIYQYSWRQPMSPLVERPGQTARLSVGEEVWVKPPNARCTTEWKRGIVTQINSDNNVSVDGMPRHILDLRAVVEGAEIDGEEESSDDLNSLETEGQAQQSSVPVEATGATGRQSGRNWHPQIWMADYV